MKTQMMNPNKVSNIDMMNNQSMMGMATLIQKLGKGKRKFEIKLEKSSKKMLEKIVEAMKKQMGGFGDNPQMKSMMAFFDYLEKESKTKDPILRLSYEELDFIKKTLSSSAKQMEEVKFKWYQFLKKSFTKMMIKQYKFLIEEFNK